MKYIFIFLLLIQSCQLVKYTKKTQLKDKNKQSQVKNSDSTKLIIKKKIEKATLAIIGFEIRNNISKDDISKDDMLTFTDRLTYSFVNSNNYIVLSREEIKTILKEHDFVLSDDCDNKCAVETGRLLSAKKIVKGAIGKVGSKYSIVVHLIDVTTGKIDKSERKDYEGDKEGLLKVFDKIGEKLSY